MAGTEYNINEISELFSAGGDDRIRVICVGVCETGKNGAVTAGDFDYSMKELEDTNLLHRGGPEGLGYVRACAARISAMPPEERINELYVMDRDLTDRGLSPGGSADMLALALLLERWQDLSGGCI